MMRVWGGGIWEPRAFWDACDELGVLTYTDMQVSCGTQPLATTARGTLGSDCCCLLYRSSHGARSKACQTSTPSWTTKSRGTRTTLRLPCGMAAMNAEAVACMNLLCALRLKIKLPFARTVAI
jgi:hypothetical protein